jgi:predicted lactoylglutathione lyase
MGSVRKLFVNIPVHDLSKSMTFFKALGFEFNPQFTNDQAACMIVNGDAFFMLQTVPHFKQFTKRPLADTTTHTEALFAVSCNSREQVDQLVNAAIRAGGSHAMDTQDHGFMYGWSFYDLDGHHWEVLWMDPAALAKSPDTVA